MKWTGLNELREMYLSFFESKGHLRMPSFSLVPQGDKSLLLINAGMAPLKKYFTGEQTPPNNRVTTCQKCIRTPDIERVGITARHGTYFEMLGNFSFGDYFKHEAIAWAWEFCTQVMEMPVENLYCSVYLDDEEAYDIWTKEIGVAEDHMVRMGKEDNFWELGVGPCGPCSEIYYDRGEKYGCGSPDCKVGCDCDRYVEFWNLVFTQFDNDGNGNYSNLAKKNIDTGMGLERLACISQDVNNLFEVDTVQNIMKHIISFAGINYHEDEKKDVSLRVITDHIRSTTFMIGDGVMPSNEGRGYVLRRLLRRAARHGRLLGITEPFLAEVCETVIKENEKAYPNLVEKHDFIVKVIQKEEESFSSTIDTGLRLLEQMVDSKSDKLLSGEEAFRLSDTYGFPIDLTKEILEERGMSVNLDEFSKFVSEQRLRSRNARKDSGADGWKDTGIVTKGLPETEFLGYLQLETPANIVAIIINGKKEDYLENNVDATIVLDKTTFYGESGGQVGDIGVIELDDVVFEVSAATKTNDGVVLHHGSVISGEGLQINSRVNASVDFETRSATARNHTAAHLLQASLRKVLGSHVEQAGQMVNANVMRFDFTHFSALSLQETEDVEKMVNSVILSAVSVISEEMNIEEAKKIGAMALFGEKYGDVVRVVKAGNVSIELCGGTHVDNTGKLGLFKIISESSVAAGVRRIEAVTGFGVLEFMKKNAALIHVAATAMKIGNITELGKRAAGMYSELKTKDREIEQLKEELSSIKAGSLLNKAVTVGPVRVVTEKIRNAGPDEIRKMCDAAKADGDDIVAVIAGLNEEKNSVNFACACAAGAVAAGAHAGNIVREVAKLADGSGGGKPESAMAGGKDASKADEALAKTAEIVASMLK